MTAVLLRMHVLVAPYRVPGNGSAVGTVYLTNPAPAGGAVVTLSTSDPLVTVPASVTIPAGATTGTFTVSAGNPAVNTQVLVNATQGTLTQRCLFTVAPAPMTVTLTKSSVVGGSTTVAKGTVTLLSPAPAGGAVVSLTSSDPACSVPATITIAAGKLTGTFTLSHSRVAAAATASITASYAGNSASGSIVVNPFAVSSIALDATQVFGSMPVNATITLNATPVAAVDVSLTSSDLTVIAAKTITIPSGQNQIIDLVQTNGVAALANLSVTASVDGGGKSKSLKVQPVIATVAFDSGTLYGNGSLGCTVTSPMAAPSGGWNVTLTGANCVVPATVTIPEGMTSVSFAVQGADVSTAATSSVEASAVASDITATKAVTPNTIATYVVDPISFVGGSATAVTGTVTLKGVVTVATDITLVSAAPGVVSVPATVTLLPGQSTVTFSMTHYAVSASRTVKLTAKRLGVNKAVTVTVN